MQFLQADMIGAQRGPTGLLADVGGVAISETDTTPLVRWGGGVQLHVRVIVALFCAMTMGGERGDGDQRRGESIAKLE